MSKYPTLKQVLDQIVKLSKSDPKFVYTDQPEYDDNGCFYIGANDKGTGRGCIVGQALLDLGVDRNRVGGFNQEEALTHVPQVLGLNETLSKEDEKILDTIQRIQENQDGGIPWGKAVKKEMK